MFRKEVETSFNLFCESMREQLSAVISYEVGILLQGRC